MLKEADAAAHAGIAQAAAVKLEDLIPDLQEILSSFALLPPDRTSFELHEIVEAMSRLKSAAMTARVIAADSMQAAAEADAGETPKAEGGKKELEPRPGAEKVAAAYPPLMKAVAAHEKKTEAICKDLLKNRSKLGEAAFSKLYLDAVQQVMPKPR